jgi:hypothetical protein
MSTAKKTLAYGPTTASPVISVYEGHEIRAFFSMQDNSKIVLPLIRKAMEKATEARMVIDYIAITPEGFIIVVPKWLGHVRFPLVFKMTKKVLEQINGGV